MLRHLSQAGGMIPYAILTTQASSIGQMGRPGYSEDGRAGSPGEFLVEDSDRRPGVKFSLSLSYAAVQEEDSAHLDTDVTVLDDPILS